MKRITIVLVLCLGGCCEPEMVDVKCIAVSYYGESPAKGSMDCDYSFMTCERLDNHERRNFPTILGKPGDRFRMNWRLDRF